MNIKKLIARTINRFVKINSYKPISCNIDEKRIKLSLNKIKYHPSLANGAPIGISTLDGNDQATHPKILSVKINNAPIFLMGINSYPFTDARYENPELLISYDGISFTNYSGSIIDIPDDVNSGGHFSDIHLTMKDNMFYVFYRYNPAKNTTFRRRSDNSKNFLFYKTSLDCKTWSERKLLFHPNSFDNTYRYFSPVVNFEDNEFRIWFTNDSGKLIYLRSKNLIDFSSPIECSIENANEIIIWHQDIIKTDKGYELICCGWDRNKGCYEKQNIYAALSQDGIHFSKLKIIMMPSKSGFDCKSLYRPTFYKKNGVYYVYYAAYDKKEEWHIGLSCGLELEKLIGFQYIQSKERVNI